MFKYSGSKKHSLPSQNKNQVESPEHIKYPPITQRGQKRQNLSLVPKSSRDNNETSANKQEFLTGQDLLVQAQDAAALRKAKEKGYQTINVSMQVSHASNAANQL